MFTSIEPWTDKFLERIDNLDLILRFTSHDPQPFYLEDKKTGDIVFYVSKHRDIVIQEYTLKYFLDGYSAARRILVKHIDNLKSNKGQ